MSTRSDSIPVFLREFIRSFHTTGAVLPSGKRLAKALASPVKEIPPPRRILEAGPGTGAVTDQLIQRLGPEDQLVLCEINPAFAEHLRRRLEDDPVWHRKKDFVTVLEEDVVQVAAPGDFDLVVSGLPLNNFEATLVEKLLRAFLDSLRPHGIHTFFEYQYVRQIRMRVASKGVRRRMAGIHRATQKSLQGFKCSRFSVNANLPPAWVYTVQKPEK